MLSLQLSIHQLHDRGEGDDAPTHIILMKGAPERIVERCTTIYIGGSDVELTDEWRERFNSAYETLGGLGERVLGFCDKHVTYASDYVFDADAGNFPMTGLRFVGLISLIDPPRPNVPSAVEKCRLAGIRVAMVTGDHPTTAKAIARIIGLISADSMTPDEQEQLRELAPDVPLRSASNTTSHWSSLRCWFQLPGCVMYILMSLLPQHVQLQPSDDRQPEML